jgi:hypothetical protein
VQRMQGDGEGADHDREAPVIWGGTCEVLEGCKDCKGTGGFPFSAGKIACETCLGLGKVLIERCGIMEG